MTPACFARPPLDPAPESPTPMYLHRLEKEEKLTFLAFARHLSTLDDQVLDANEKYRLRYMAIEMGLNPDDPTGFEIPPYSLADVQKVFFREEAQRVLVLEGVGIASATGDMKWAQRDLLAKLVKTFGLPVDFLHHAEGVIRKQLEVMDAFDALVTPPTAVR